MNRLQLVPIMLLAGCAPKGEGNVGRNTNKLAQAPTVSITPVAIASAKQLTANVVKVELPSEPETGKGANHPLGPTPGRKEPLPWPLPAPTVSFDEVLATCRTTMSERELSLEQLNGCWELLSQVLPAIDESGHRLWFNTSYYPCCAENGVTKVEVWRRDSAVRNGVSSHQWTLFRTNQNGESMTSVAQSRNALGALLKELGKSRPRALSTIILPSGELSELDVRWGNRGIWLEPSHESVLWLRVDDRDVSAVKLPSFRQPQGFCCGNEDATKGCDVPAQIQGVWFDDAAGVLVAQLGNNGGPDGCEQKPKWLTMPWPSPNQ